MKRILIIASLALFALLVVACGSTEVETEVETVVETAVETVTEQTDTTTADTTQVEIALFDELDGILNGYCIDIAGGNENVDPANGLQAHTCYSYDGSLGTDQVFDTGQFANNVLYMPIYDVCAQADSLTAGTEVGLATCDGSEAQSFTFTAEGNIIPTAAPDLCFTANAESRMGRGSEHQIRDMTLELCSADLAAYQQWGTRVDLASGIQSVSSDTISEANTTAVVEETTEDVAEVEEVVVEEEVAAEEVAEETADIVEETAEEMVEEVIAEEVEIYLVDELDGILNGYCIDIAGGNENVDPANGLQAHTCYSYDGALGTDQVFDTGSFVNNILYMPIYDVCAQADSLTAGTEVGLATCDGSEAQSFIFTAEGNITPTAAPDLCFTANAESRMGRGSEHQIRNMTLELCSADFAAYQIWAIRTGLE